MHSLNSAKALLMLCVLRLSFLLAVVLLRTTLTTCCPTVLSQPVLFSISALLAPSPVHHHLSSFSHSAVDS
uniref:Putative secreted protein n=1 Tax=Panstrongylus lignarius TaxID=156445 RepID=A0A224Y4S1_9HEMI